MTETTRKFLIFTLASRRYALDLAQVAEVVEQPATWPIPLAPSCYIGAMNFHGTIIAVMNLALFLGLPGGYGTEKTIVLDTRIASLALSVEDIIRISPLGQAELSGAPAGEAFACGLLSLPEGKATLLDSVAMAEHAARTING